MEISQLEYFDSVAYTQSISESAHNLQITPQTISSAIRSLEYELGVKLFDRNVSGLSLNENGREYLETVRKMLFILSISEQQIKITSKKVNKEISIGILTSDTAFTACIAKYITIESDIVFHLLDASLISENGICSTMDFLFGIPATDRSIPAEYESFPLFQQTRYVLMRRDHAPLQRKSIGIEELKDSYWVAHKNQNREREQTTTICEANGFHPNIRLTSDNNICKKIAVLEGEMICLISSKDLSFYSDDRLIALPLSTKVNNECCLCWKSTKELTPQAQLFLNYVQSYYSQKFSK